MKLLILGTGNAAVTKIYNSTFIIQDDKQNILVDGGGGNQIFKKLEDFSLTYKDIADIIVTHKHLDHIMGVIWMIRFILQGYSRNSYDKDVTIYSHQEVIDLLKDFSYRLFSEKETAYIDKKLHFVTIEDNQEVSIQNKKFTFFDIHSTKATQYGFMMIYDNNKKLTCLGDEPYNPENKQYAINADYLLSESFCLYQDKDIFKPYQKQHSTVKDAAILAQDLQVKNLVLYHSEDSTIQTRKQQYTFEAKQYFFGNIFVPEDNEIIELD